MSRSRHKGFLFKTSLRDTRRIIFIGGGLMSKVLEAKQAVVQEIADKFENSKSAVLVDYRGLNVAEITALRKELRDNNIDYKVYKNTMTHRAIEGTDLEGLQETLSGPTAIAFGSEDVVSPARILHKFAKDNEALEIKGGMIEGEIATLDQIKELSTLPDHDGLVSMLLSVLQAPIRNLAYATKAIAEQKEETAE